ncbi:hypothetical protein PG993_001224 [Apiospora rasikravindrae]|uniref:Uncharacterized protein n=1 Tax=Apiospora rasikravindrae TaxID=990691 RepID=A0ABR1UAS9_9PEZI
MSLTKLNHTGVYVVEVTPSDAPCFEALWKLYGPQFNSLPPASTSPLPSSRELPAFVITTKKFDRNEEDDEHEKRSKKDEQSDSSDSKLGGIAQYLKDSPPQPDCPRATPRKQHKCVPARRHRRRSSKLPELQEVKDLADVEDDKNHGMRTYAQILAHPRHPRPYPRFRLPRRRSQRPGPTPRALDLVYRVSANDTWLWK